MSSPEHTLDPVSDDGHGRLERTIAAASAQGEHESPAVCDAVDDIVVQARENGEPPERVLVAVKERAYRVLGQLRVPIEGARTAIAWIVRCAVKAYYRGA